jgi:hypothetical protein
MWHINPGIFTDQEFIPSSVRDLRGEPENYEASDNMEQASSHAEEELSPHLSGL